MPTPRRPWTRSELLLALHLYHRLPFGQQHTNNAEIQRLALVLNRTPGSVAMKLNNLTALDPEELKRGVNGLPGASALDRRTWDEQEANPVDTAAESEALWQARVETPSPAPIEEPTAPLRLEDVSLQRVRLAQSFFRRLVLANFDGRCALTGISHPALVNASHIVGWAEHDGHRGYPLNSIALKSDFTPRVPSSTRGKAASA